MRYLAPGFFFTQIRPVLVGDLVTRSKYPKLCWFRLENHHFVLLSSVADIAKKTINAVANIVNKF
jgi:hypothetical protein